MDQKFDELLVAVQGLREELKPQPEPFFKKVVHVLEKLVIPVMLGVVAWIGNQAATKISEGQLHLAESAAEDRKVEFRRGMQAKYIEIFYKDLNSGDPKNQLNSIRLVRLVDGELAQSLLDLVAVTPGVSQAVVTKAGEVKRELEVLRPLGGYKIGIYFYRNDPLSTSSAVKMQEHLRGAGFVGVVQQYPSDDAFFEKVSPPATLEVRYEEGIEEDAANALLGIVQAADNKSRWAKRQVNNRTTNFLSVFVPKGG